MERFDERQSDFRSDQLLDESIAVPFVVARHSHRRRRNLP
jgi:hypothetical protein